MALTKKQEIVIKALADGLSNKDAAALAKMNEKSISKLKNDKNFTVSLALACADRLKGILPKAISKLEEIVTSDNPEYYTQQIQAIRMILEYSNIIALTDTGDSNIVVSVRYE